MARKFTDPDNAKYAFDGYGLDHAFIATTGKPLIGLAIFMMQTSKSAWICSVHSMILRNSSVIPER